MVFLFRLLSYLPLRVLHAMGTLAGWLVYLMSGRYRKRWNDNRKQAGLTSQQVRGAIAHNGRMLLELPRLWLGKPVPVYWNDSVQHITQAYEARRGIIFLTPHIGCFEVSPQMVAERFSAKYGDLTVMYKPASQPWLAEMMRYARNRPGLKTITTSTAGVRQMLRELRSGHAVGLLPDHVPPQGQGVWAAFFGRPAYSMRLVCKLVQQTNASLLLLWAERLPAGRGYLLHCNPVMESLSNDPTAAATQINHAMEQIILKNPQQYMWNYARYREPPSHADSH